MEGSDNSSGTVALSLAPSEVIAWCVIFGVEALVAITSNVATIAIFLTNKRIRAQTSILLVNLAVADLLVATVPIPGWVYFFGAQANLWADSTHLAGHITYSALDIGGAFASVTNHGCIAVERLIATLLPFKYRSSKRIITTQLIIVVWMCAVCIPVVTLVGFHVLHSNMVAFFVWMPFLTVLLLVITVSYSILLGRMKWLARNLHDHEGTEQRNHRFTVTALMVTVVSLLAWLPFMIMSAINLVAQTISHDVRLVSMVKLLHFFNSICSIFIYWFRIPNFKAAAYALVFRRHGMEQPERHRALFQSRRSNSCRDTATTAL
ncbi:somatostatin receptor type 4-like [Pocillopora verrucosa]|uniref:somatostatin receptor type 4-like n=1 Tax=Pocillopora verrucosa TaxID=203993 RepID=UPI00279737D2|nr:pyroglutamylated RF-amide peptide receptor-like [Pocillopora verrucosa]